MIGILDYGVGNLFSLQSSLAAIGAESKVISEVGEIWHADKLILPGVGAFSDAMAKLKDCKADKAIREYAESGRDIMGICLGMQLLFDKSFEYGKHEGLGLLKGDIVPISERVGRNMKIPHIGWNTLKIKNNSGLFRYIKSGDCVYFVHSYFADCPSDEIIAVTEYEIELTAACADGNIMGCQFHPEKSGSVGLAILKAFCEGAAL